MFFHRTPPQFPEYIKDATGGDTPYLLLELLYHITCRYVMSQATTR